MKLYTPLIEEALKIAYNAHHGQFDKSGVPYIYHPTAVAEQMDTEEEIIIALLHDVIEDTDITLADLKRRHFPSAVLEALTLLTHQENSNYENYLIRIAHNPLALKIKLADIAHNNNPERNARLPEKLAERCREKYNNAIVILAEHSEK